MEGLATPEWSISISKSQRKFWFEHGQILISVRFLLDHLSHPVMLVYAFDYNNDNKVKKKKKRKKKTKKKNPQTNKDLKD